MEGEPYIARWPDKQGNLQSKPIPRPDAVAKYFRRSNRIDSHNHVRQKELGLEIKWRTTDCWFRLVTTIIGIVVTDCWKALLYHKSSSPKLSKMRSKRFAECLCWDLWNIKRKIATKVVDYIPLMTDSDGIEVQYGGSESRSTIISPTSSLGSVTNFSCNLIFEHTLAKTNQITGVARQEPTRRACSIKADGCKGLTMYECQHPKCFKETKTANRFRKASGTFICLNTACHLKHVANFTM